MNGEPETPTLGEVPDIPARTGENTVAGAGPRPDGDPAFQRLRELLFLREMELLRALEKRLDDPVQHARETSEVIAEAVLLRAQKDNMLYTALEPMAEKLFKEALRRSPMDFVNALFPIMGPAIRRSIAETFRSMLEGFHKTVELVFSWKGLRWRWEALRTGMSFSELVLLHTLLYRVEQIFFIHAETGLVLNHVFDEGVATQDADMVSAMLTAIQDFARDCFASEQGGSLDSLQLGEFGILVERGTTAYLACVVRGTVPLEFKQKLRDTMIAMQIKYADDLNAFTGDSGKFAASRWELEDLLDTRLADTGAPLPLWVKLMPMAVGLLLAAGAGYWWYEARQRDIERRYMEESLVQVGKEPGILLVEARRDDVNHWEVIYQKDPLAKDPKTLLDARGIDPGTYTMLLIPFVSYETDMVTRRVKERIDPPENVSMEFDGDGTLRLRGKASMGWILQARQEALALPGVEKVDMSGLTDPRIDELKRMIALVEGTVVEFPLGKDVPVPEDAGKLARAMDTLSAIEKLAGGMNVSVNLTVYGHADATGNDKRNYEISQARARTIAAMLYARGSSMPIAMYGLGADYANREGAENGGKNHPRGETSEYTGDRASRKVELKVHLAQLPSDAGVLNLLR
ncbi:MAG: OmpA family protein [Candidatus Accumulibacter sp.]|nr:OmpA family protein [Accumulibacter sp.]